MLVLPGAHRKMPDCAGGIGHVRKNHCSSRTQVLVRVGFRNGVEHVEVISNCQMVINSRELQEGVAEVSAARESATVERRVEGPVGGEKEDVAARIGCRTRT